MNIVDAFENTETFKYFFETFITKIISQYIKIYDLYDDAFHRAFDEEIVIQQESRDNIISIAKLSITLIIRVLSDSV